VVTGVGVVIGLVFASLLILGAVAAAFSDPED
jgi:hypothetical protein